MAPRLKNIVPFCKIGVVFGILTIRYNPHKRNIKDGPFEVSAALLLYSFAVWTVFILTCVHLHQDFRLSRPRLIPPLRNMFAVINCYYILFLWGQRRSVAVIYNMLFSLLLKHPTAQISSGDLLRLLFPLVVYIFKIIFDYDWYIQTPVFHLLGVFYIIIFVTVYGNIYCWLVYGQKFLNCIIDELHSKHRSQRITKDVVNNLLDVEEFVRTISKYFGMFHLLIGIQVLGVYISHLSSKVMVILNIRQFNKATFQTIIHVMEWNFFVFLMFFTTYQSHKLTLQVQRLKHNLEDVCSKENLNSHHLRIILLIKSHVQKEEMIFSAFQSVKFSIQLVFSVLNNIVTFMTTMSTISWKD